jgi:hypothetical protein
MRIFLLLWERKQLKAIESNGKRVLRFVIAINQLYDSPMNGNLEQFSHLSLLIGSLKGSISLAQGRMTAGNAALGR